MMKQLHKAAALLVLAVSLALTGCGGAAPKAEPAPAAPTGTEVVVQMKDMRFIPDKVTIRVGQTVIFRNTDAMEHDVKQTTPAKINEKSALFASPIVPPGGEFRYTFKEAGNYPILCTVAGHYSAGMIGSVTVEK